MSSRAALEMIAGLLLLFEGLGVCGAGFLFLTMGAADAGLGALVFLPVVLGAPLIWAAAVLAGFALPRSKDGVFLATKGAALVALLVGGAVYYFGGGILLVASCSGGMNCSDTVPPSVDTTPAILLAFNLVAAVMLWFKHPAKPR